MRCYQVRLPTPGHQFYAFTTLNGVGEIKFEVDSSAHADLDFDVLYFNGKLTLVQVDLRNRETRSKSIALPQGFYKVNEIMSTQMVTLLDQNQSHRAYDICSEELISIPPLEYPHFLETDSAFYH